MSNFIKRLFAIFILGSGITAYLVFMIAPKVSAAPAQCFWDSSDQPMAVVNCASYQAVLTAGNVKSAAADTCYLMQEAPANEGWVGVPTVTNSPLNSETCKGWQSISGVVAKTSAKCYTANASVKDYTDHKVTQDKVSDAKCDPAFLAKQASKTGVKSFTNGVCYVMFSKPAKTNIITSVSCDSFQAELTRSQSELANQPVKYNEKDGSGAVTLQGPAPSGDVCGDADGNSSVKLSIDIGCEGKGNSIVDMLFAFIRFLSLGVGIIVVGSMIVAGIQYTTTAGDPQAVAAARKRIYNTVIALIVFIFTYALLNWIIPAGILK